MKKIVVLLGISLFMASCGALSGGKSGGGSAFQGKTLFTHELRQQIESFSDIKKVQFYTTRRIKMTRVSSSDGIEVTEDGKVVVKESAREEVITLERELPGVCVAAYEDRLHISFSEGSYVVFRRDFVGTYSLLVERDFRGVARLQYGTETYELAPGSDEAKLAIQKDFKNEDEDEERNESGRRIGSGSSSGTKVKEN